MKNIYYLCLTMLVTISAGAQVIDFPDTNLKQRLLYSFTVDTDNNGLTDSSADINGDGDITIQEAAVITNLDLHDLSTADDNDDITNLEGLENFTALEFLDVSYHKIIAINISLPALKTLYCDSNLINSFVFDGIQNLEYISLAYNPVTNIDFSNLVFLQHIQSEYCPLTSVNLTGCTGLKQLWLHNCELNSLSVSDAVNLEILSCTANPVTSLDVSALSELRVLYCDGTEITSLDLSGLQNLESVFCGFGPLSSLNINNCSAMTHLSCPETQLTNIDFSQGLTSLFQLDCHGSLFTSIDLSETPAQELHFYDNLELEYINIRNGVISDCMFGTQPTDYTCHMFMNLPLLEYVCVDDAEATSFFTGGPQANVQFITDCSLSIKDHVLNTIVLSPNPVHDEVYIRLTDSEVIETVEIYNMLGQKLKYVYKPSNIIDTSFLEAGTYIMCVKTLNEYQALKFIKI